MAYDNSRMRREIGLYLKKSRDEGLTPRYLSCMKYTLFNLMEHCKGYGIQCARKVSSEAVLSFLEK